MLKTGNLAMSVKGTFGDKNLQGQVREYKDDIYKSLDTVIQERGYKKPPSYRGSKFVDEEETKRRSITGGDEKLLSDPRTRPSSSSTFTCRTVGKLDAMSNSLDAIINDRGVLQDDKNNRGERDEEREGFYEKRKRFLRREFEEKVRQDERDSESTNGHRAKRPRVANKMTPYQALTFLADTFMEIVMKMGKKVKYTDTSEDKIPQKWRCIVKCGAIEGIAESFRKIVAREIACLEFLNKLKEVYPDGKIPEYELANEIFLDPKIYETIRILGKESGAQINVDIGNDERAIGFGDKPAEMYKCTYHLDKQQFIGRSASKEFAQLKAAGKLYESLTGTEFPLSKYSVGSDCDSFEEYDFSESQKWID